MAARVIAVANQKGGSGKTALAVNLACALAELGKSVLLVDVDPQADATNLVGIGAGEGPSLYEVIGQDAPLSTAIVREVAPGVDLVPGSESMSGLEAVLAGANFRERYLANALEPAVEHYDVILLDCPPNLGILSVNALVAADDVLIVVSMVDRNAYKGAHALRETIDGLKQAGVKVRIAGVLRNYVDERRQVYQALNEALETQELLPLLKTEIPMRADFQTAAAVGEPLLRRHPDGIAARAIRSAASELLAVVSEEAVAA
jgi:chromosome partitioning protein